jgi:hypothetical protein
MKFQVKKNKNTLPQQSGWEYLEEIDRKEYQKMSVIQKLRIVSALNRFWWTMVQHSPQQKQILNNLEQILADKVKTYQRMNRTFKNAQ